MLRKIELSGTPSPVYSEHIKNTAVTRIDKVDEKIYLGYAIVCSCHSCAAFLPPSSSF